MVGEGHEGDIALDDIVFGSGCEFNNNPLPPGTTPAPTPSICAVATDRVCDDTYTCVPQAKVRVYNDCALYE